MFAVTTAQAGDKLRWYIVTGKSDANAIRGDDGLLGSEKGDGDRRRLPWLKDALSSPLILFEATSVFSHGCPGVPTELTARVRSSAAKPSHLPVRPVCRRSSLTSCLFLLVAAEPGPMRQGITCVGTDIP